jgi:hypothetical protein
MLLVRPAVGQPQKSLLAFDMSIALAARRGKELATLGSWHY